MKDDIMPEMWQVDMHSHCTISHITSCPPSTSNLYDSLDVWSTSIPKVKWKQISEVFFSLAQIERVCGVSKNNLHSLFIEIPLSVWMGYSCLTYPFAEETCHEGIKSNLKSIKLFDKKQYFVLLLQFSTTHSTLRSMNCRLFGMRRRWWWWWWQWHKRYSYIIFLVQWMDSDDSQSVESERQRNEKNTFSLSLSRITHPLIPVLQCEAAIRALYGLETEIHTISRKLCRHMHAIHYICI